jgi:hypothetical protein
MQEVVKKLDISDQHKNDIRGYLEILEEQMDQLLGIAPSVDHGHPVMDLHQGVARIKRASWALQRFPIFDLNVLKLMKEHKLRVKPFNQEEKEVTLYVPQYYWGYSGGGNARWDPHRPSWQRNFPHTWEIGKHKVRYSEQALEHNKAALENTNVSNVECEVPRVPIDVEQRVARVQSHFDCIQTIFEASWSPVAAPDPFIVGFVHTMAFLIDQFDLTKAERYILSEFVTKKV